MPSPKHLLIIDDSPTIIQLLRFGLARIPGVVCEEAGNGQQALQLLSQQPFDLILCDINMPVMDGFTFLEQFRRLPGCDRIPVVMITTEGSVEDQERAMKCGATAYLTKPVQIPKLLETVKRFLAPTDGAKQP